MSYIVRKKTMKVLQIGIFGAVLVWVASCSTTGAGDKYIDYGATNKQVSPLDVPPDLTTPDREERYLVPQDAATRDNTARGNTAGVVLPEFQGVRLERSGTQRWLAVSDTPENVWPVVKAFWLEIGLVIASADPAAGVMETDWAENRAKIPQSAIRNVLGKVFDSAYSSGERDRYLTRLERGRDGAITEVHITHRGLVQVYSPDMTTYKWVARANDPELEAVMLQRLMVRLGASEAQAASAVAATGSTSGIPTSGTPTSDIPTSGTPATGTLATGITEPTGTASLREISGNNVVIVINDSFDKAWRKAGLAIESSGLAVEDKDRNQGIYYLRPVKIERGWWEKLKFWKAAADAKKQYRVLVKESAAVHLVSVTDQDGASSSVTKQMIETMYKNINQ